jgi:hypothetical protein
MFTRISRGIAAAALTVLACCLTPSAGLAAPSSLRISAPPGAPAGEIAREITLAYPGEARGFSVTLALAAGESGGAVAISDTEHGQLALLQPGANELQYASTRPATIRLQLYNWSSSPFDVVLEPGDLAISSDAVNSACAPQ